MKNYTAIVLLMLVGCSSISRNQPTCRVPSECVGTWREVEQIGWKNSVVTPEENIKELVIKADGSFSVTWHPFETYCDFWGVCHFPHGTNTALFYVLSGNHIPKYFDGRGSYRFFEGNLILDDLFFGHPRAQQDKLTEPVKAIFGHKFKKTGPPPSPPQPMPRTCHLCGKKFKICPGCHSLLTDVPYCNACRMDICPECVESQNRKRPTTTSDATSEPARGSGSSAQQR